jgi:hypothetical protein
MCATSSGRPYSITTETDVTGMDEPTNTYYLNDTVPTKIVYYGGRRAGWALRLATGGWRALDDSQILAIEWDAGGPVLSLTRDWFIYHVEYDRSRTYRRTGPLSEIYEAARHITEPDGRGASDIPKADRTILEGLFARTYPMFEAMLRDEGDPGADLDAAAQYPPGTVTWHRAP